jgi:hypothetical protein
MDQPKQKHRAWAEMIRTAAAIATLLISIGLFAAKVGWW